MLHNFWLMAQKSPNFGCPEAQWNAEFNAKKIFSKFSFSQILCHCIVWNFIEQFLEFFISFRYRNFIFMSHFWRLTTWPKNFFKIRTFRIFQESSLRSTIVLWKTKKMDSKPTLTSLRQIFVDRMFHVPDTSLSTFFRLQL